LYPEGSVFESKLAHRLSQLRVFVLFLSSSWQMLKKYIDWVTTVSFQILPNSLITTHPTLKAGIATGYSWAADGLEFEFR
jgi:hypothetical protein